MAGRHAAHTAPEPSARRRGGRVSAAVAAVVLLVAAGITAVVVLRPGDHSDATGHRAGPAPASPACTGELSVPVLAAPSVQPSISAVASRWNASRPAVRGRCVHAVVTAEDPAAAVSSLATNTGPVLWIPDSTMWSDKLAAAPALAGAVTADGSIGSSPLVVATSPTRAAALRKRAAAGWAGVLAGGVTITDPTTTAPGALTVFGVGAQESATPGASATLAGLFMRLSSAVLPSADAGLAGLAAHPRSAPAFVTSEQDVFLANRGKSAAVVSAVYPSGATPMLDFPMVRVAVAGAGPLVAAAVTQFERQLTSPSARALLAQDGLRAPSGAPLSEPAATGTLAQRVQPATAILSKARQAATMRLWTAVAKPSQLLAAIDVSGSMTDNSGNGMSKIQVLTGAAETALRLLPANWTVGLWTFAQHSPPATDWSQLAPLTAVKTGRRALLDAAATLPDKAGGDTGLYNTTLAAFQDVEANYDPSAVNIVAVLTDGADSDPDSIGLPALLSRLRAEYDPAKPVRIITIGVGDDVDVGALSAIAQATHGQSYIVKSPRQILGAVLGSVLDNNM